ncbi:MAG: hypothetical protein N3A66_08710 [Planctomycetota bacterium]|nr:hypothetical protein [Planctomycetota bacterium]
MTLPRLLPLWATALLWLPGCDTGVFADPNKKEKAEILAEEKEKRQIAALLAAKSEADFEREINKLVHSGEVSAAVVIAKVMLQTPLEPQTLPSSQREGRKQRLARELRRLIPAQDYQALLERYFRALSQNTDAAKVAEERLTKWLEQNKEFLEWDPYLLRFELKPQRQPGTFGR